MMSAQITAFHTVQMTELEAFKKLTKHKSEETEGTASFDLEITNSAVACWVRQEKNPLIWNTDGASEVSHT